MATDVHNTSEPSMTKLVGGIIDDAQKLFKQQAELFQADIKREIRQAKQVGLNMVLAGSLMGAGGLVLLFMLVHLLHYLFPDLKLWGAHAIVGGVLFAIGLGLYFAGREKLDKLSPLPEQSVEGLKENLQWKTNPN